MLTKHYAFNQFEFKWFDTKTELAKFLGVTEKWLDQRLKTKIPMTQGYFIGKAGIEWLQVGKILKREELQV